MYNTTIAGATPDDVRILKDLALVAVMALERIQQQGTTPQGNTVEAMLAYEALQKINIILWKPDPALEAKKIMEKNKELFQDLAAQEELDKVARQVELLRLEGRVGELAFKNDVYRHALEFYADKEKYMNYHFGQDLRSPKELYSILNDQGDVARIALNENVSDASDPVSPLEASMARANEKYGNALENLGDSDAIEKAEQRDLLMDLDYEDKE